MFGCVLFVLVEWFLLLVGSGLVLLNVCVYVNGWLCVCWYVGWFVSLSVSRFVCTYVSVGRSVCTQVRV